MSWNYQVEYKKLLIKLENHKADWINIDAEKPPEDGTLIYFKCSENYMGEIQYDVGYWADYTNTHWYQLCVEAGDDVITGEWDTEFGVMGDGVIAWKLVEYKK